MAKLALALLFFCLLESNLTFIIVFLHWPHRARVFRGVCGSVHKPSCRCFLFEFACSSQFSFFHAALQKAINAIASSSSSVSSSSLDNHGDAEISFVQVNVELWVYRIQSWVCRSEFGVNVVQGKLN